MIRIFIVEDHPIMRQSLRALLSREPDLEVCGDAPTAEDALVHIDDVRPDMVLVDVSLPGMNGIQLVRVLHQHHPALTVAMLSGHGGAAHVEQALQAGARGYVLKGRASELPAAIRKMIGGERYVSRELDGAL